MSAPKKRKASEIIDLTDDTEDAESLQAAKIPRSSQASQPHLSQLEIREDSTADDDNGDELLDEQQYGEGREQYGTVETKIVGCQYYNGICTEGEHVHLIREPHNHYDQNAIRVDNMLNQQVGHIPRGIAAKLAPYLDDGSLLPDALINGRKGLFDCPVAVRLFGTCDVVLRQALKMRMKEDRLPVKELIERERQEKAEKKAQEQQAKDLKKKKRLAELAGVAAGTGNAEIDVDENLEPEYSGSTVSEMLEKAPSLEEILGGSEEYTARSAGDVGSQFGMNEERLEKLPLAEQPKGVATSMLPYQRQGLQWMLDKENPILPEKGSQQTVQLWQHTKDGNYRNLATNLTIKSKPMLGHGGIFADDMGLGKTLQVISLIVADREQQKSNSVQPTLIVCPAGVMSNWSGQIAHHVGKTHALKVYVFHGAGKKKMTPEDFAEPDIVITTYATLSMDFVPSGSKKPAAIPRKHGLYSLTWRRIVLDEAHQIRNPATKSSLAANALQSDCHWALTGTPIINTLKDLYSLCRFIKLTGGLENQQVYNSVLTRQFKRDAGAASILLQALMSSICLRRHKEMKFVDLRLPELKEYIHRIAFSDFEKERYEALLLEAKGLLKRFEQEKKSKDDDKGGAYRNLLEILLRLRQMCNHWKLCPSRVEAILKLAAQNKAVSLTPENVTALQDMLQLSIDSHEECPICLDSLHDPVITACTHVFGLNCIERVIENQHKCPMCRAELPDNAVLVKPRLDLGETEAVKIDTDESSSKVDAIINILTASAEKTGTKTIVFLQWTSFLNIIEARLAKLGIGYTRIDGSMKIPERDEAQRTLETYDSCNVMLASLAVCSVGLNLVAANQVILSDSWWAPAIEDQAVDRVHRLGQQRPTTVFKLVMEGSIEERVLDIQAEKRELAHTAFQDKRTTRGAGQATKLKEIKTLLG